VQETRRAAKHRTKHCFEHILFQQAIAEESSGESWMEKVM
jgi:hypothetical protein